MSFVTVLLAAAESEHVALALPTWAYGAIALVIFVVLAFVVWNFQDVSNRHALQADAYAAPHGAAPGHGGGH